MSIWVYEPKLASATLLQQYVSTPAWPENCLFCRERLHRLHEERGREPHDEIAADEGWFRFCIDVCPLCGWWLVQREFLSINFTERSSRYGPGDKEYTRHGMAGCLKSLNAPDHKAPIEEVRSYLALNYDARFKIHPRVFEETVASVFSSLGYQARATNYSGDDGIDVILDGPNDEMLGVQVKRYRHAIQVNQIRELTGALVIGGYTRGIFVTTSAFQSGAKRTAELSKLKGFPIELMDATAFFDALKIAQREHYTNWKDPAAPFSSIELEFILHDDFWAAGGAYDDLIVG